MTTTIDVQTVESDSMEIVKSQSTGFNVKSLDDLRTLATMLSKSGFFSDAQQASQAGVKVLTGIEMGFPSIASMTGIHIVKGKVQIGAGLIAAAIKRSPKYHYKIAKDEQGLPRFNNQECVLIFLEKLDGQWEECGISSFTIDDAQKAGTGNLEKFPRNMLFARAISNGAKWFCPDIFLGVTPYTEGEIEEVGEEGIPMIPIEDLSLSYDDDSYEGGEF